MGKIQRIFQRRTVAPGRWHKIFFEDDPSIAEATVAGITGFWGICLILGALAGVNGETIIQFWGGRGGWGVGLLLLSVLKFYSIGTQCTPGRRHCCFVAALIWFFVVLQCLDSGAAMLTPTFTSGALFVINAAIFLRLHLKDFQGK